MKILIWQFDPVWENIPAGMENIKVKIDSGIPTGDLIIFPEMSLSGFTMNSRRFAERMDDKTVRFFSGIARETNISICFGMIEQAEDQYFNSLVHMDNSGKIVSVYRKIHPFSYSRENVHYNSGTKTVISEIGEWRAGLSICYDLRFPELFRQYGKQRAELIINIANWPQTRVNHWVHLLKARAIENQCVMVGVNRVGKDKGNIYSGDSCVFGPLGEEILHCDASEGIRQAEINIETVLNTREKFPFLDDIRLV